MDELDPRYSFRSWKSPHAGPCTIQAYETEVCYFWEGEPVTVAQHSAGVARGRALVTKAIEAATERIRSPEWIKGFH